MSLRKRTAEVIAIRARQSARPVYEDFQPEIDTNEEEGARVIILRVPGFLKEQMKITSEQGNIRVHGQRPLLGNRWSRFNVLLPIPLNCNAPKIHAKYQHGTLTITMPKEITGLALSSPVKEKPAEQTSLVKEQHDEDTYRRDTPDNIPPKVAASTEFRAQKGTEKATQLAAKDERQKSEIDPLKSIEKLKPPQKIDSETKTDVKKVGQGQKEEKNEKQKEIAGDSADPLKVPSEQIHKKAQTGQEASSSRQNYTERKIQEILNEPKKEGKVAEDSQAKGKESTGKVAENPVSSAASKDSEGINGNKLGIKSIANTAKQTVSNVAMKLSEDDRQLLINIGSAVLVLVALGAYISLGNFGSAETGN